MQGRSYSKRASPTNLARIDSLHDVAPDYLVCLNLVIEVFAAANEHARTGLQTAIKLISGQVQRDVLLPAWTMRVRSREKIATCGHSFIGPGMVGHMPDHYERICFVVAGHARPDF